MLLARGSKQPAITMKSAKSFAFALQQNEVQRLRFRHSAPSCSRSPAVTLFAAKSAKRARASPPLPQEGAPEYPDVHGKAAKRLAGVPARRISTCSLTPPRKGRAPLYRSGASFSPASPCSCQRLCHAACRKKSKHPAKALPPSITAIYPVCHAACRGKASAPPARTKARKASRLGLNVLRSGSLYSFRPNPLACKKAARPEYRPCCPKATASRTKNIPRGTG